MQHRDECERPRRQGGPALMSPMCSTSPLGFVRLLGRQVSPGAGVDHPRWLKLSAMLCNISGCRRNGVMMSTGSGKTTVEF
jgi:hypothetical protein